MFSLEVATVALSCQDSSAAQWECCFMSPFHGWRCDLLGAAVVRPRVAVLLGRPRHLCPLRPAWCPGSVPAPCVVPMVPSGASLPVPVPSVEQTTHVPIQGGA